MNDLNLIGECDFRVAKEMWVHCFPYMEEYIETPSCRWNKEECYIYMFGSIIKRDGERWYESYTNDLIFDEHREVVSIGEAIIDVYGTLETLLIAKIKRHFQYVIDDFFLDVVMDGKIKSYSSKFECAKRGRKYSEGDMYTDEGGEK